MSCLNELFDAGVDANKTDFCYWSNDIHSFEGNPRPWIYKG